MPPQLQMIWPESKSAPEVHAPAGYEVRPLRPGDEAGHVRVMIEAGFENWTEQRLAGWRDLHALPDGISVAVETASGRVAATAMACHKPRELHPCGGELGYVAASPEHAGKGLGLAVCAAVVRRLADVGYRRIYLLTDDHRLAAIKTYLKLGFVPFLFAEDMEARWRDVCERLGWPFDPAACARAPRDQWIEEPPETRTDNKHPGQAAGGGGAESQAAHKRDIEIRRRPMGMKIGICGAGKFARHFIQLFQAHPLVDEVRLAELDADRLAEAAREFGVEKTCPSLDDLCKSDCDAIAIFTQRWRHAPQAIQALKAGKHVWSSVPAAVTLDELAELVETVESTGLVYMLAETSYYRPQTIYCRERFAKGDFGRFVYGEGQYHHDMSHFYNAYRATNGEAWKRFASFPPMLYPTHSVAHVLSVTFRRMTSASCLGFADDHRDGVFDEKLSHWGNAFSNETALFRVSDGGAARVNEFRRIGAGESRMSIMGTLGAYEEQAGSAVWSRLEFGEGYEKDGRIDYAAAKDAVKRVNEDASDVRSTGGVTITEENLGDLPRDYLGKEFQGVSPIHPVQRLPKEFAGLPNGHSGSHHFLAADFIEAVAENRLPPNHVWLAARYNAPGIVAHESAKRDGELLAIPDFGLPPKDAATLDDVYPLL